jgi:hypothetical protein
VPSNHRRRTAGVTPCDGYVLVCGGSTPWLTLARKAYALLCTSAHTAFGSALLTGPLGLLAGDEFDDGAHCLFHWPGQVASLPQRCR